MQIKIAYGRHGKWIQLPDSVTIDVIEPKYVTGLPDESAAIAQALAYPIGTLPFADLIKPGDRVAIVFSDLTRPIPNDRVLPPLFSALEAAGVTTDQIVLINALGTHRPQTQSELVGMLGKQIVNRYTIMQHDACDFSKMLPVIQNHAGRQVFVNRQYLEADVRILTGLIEPHLFAGFSGGPKAVLPGICDIDTILDNHGVVLLSNPLTTYANLDFNPVWDEMAKVATATNPSFLLNVAVNRDREITGVFAGDLLQAHRCGVEFVRRSAVQLVRGRYDLVITSNSGYPLDLNFYQTIKGESAAARIVKPGGHILIMAECRDGVPDHGEYRNLLWECDSPQFLLQKILTPGFRRHDQWVAQIHAQILSFATVHLYSNGLSDDEMCRAFVTPCHSVEALVAEVLHDTPGARIAVLPEGSQTVPISEE